MKIKTWQVIVTAVLVLLLVLFVPVVVKRPASKVLYGPSLSDVDYTEVTFQSGELNLAAMLILPKGGGPFPVAVFIHGAGTSRRDNPWYLSFAKHFQENGIAVLLPDKRGSEQSEGRWQEASFFDLAEDALVAVEFVKTQSSFEYSAIGIIGMSQGGWIAPLVAPEDEDISFVISVSGAAVSTDEQLVHEEVNTIHNMGVYKFLARAIAPISSRSIKNKRQKEFWDKIGGFDPIPYWKAVTVPVFVAFGEKDEYDNVPVVESVRRLRSLNKSNITVKVYPGGGHAVEDPRTHYVQKQLQNDLVAFINKISAQNL
ncbi:MAG: alpha/beta fold hydrolase [Spirochaetaceae bacterium]|nr:MAG: alpha/beta fold hydrolase [Spirochaetaceae bacterium]